MLFCSRLKEAFLERFSINFIDKRIAMNSKVRTILAKLYTLPISFKSKNKSKLVYDLLTNACYETSANGGGQKGFN